MKSELHSNQPTSHFEIIITSSVVYNFYVLYNFDNKNQVDIY